MSCRFPVLSRACVFSCLRIWRDRFKIPAGLAAAEPEAQTARVRRSAPMEPDGLADLSRAVEAKRRPPETITKNSSTPEESHPAIILAIP